MDLLGNGLDLSGLDVEPSLEQVHGAEGPDPGLVTLHGGQVVGLRLLQKFVEFFHNRFLRLYYSFV